MKTTKHFFFKIYFFKKDEEIKKIKNIVTMSTKSFI